MPLCPINNMVLCREKECAWWASRQKLCAVLSIAEDLDALQGEVADLKDTMADIYSIIDERMAYGAEDDADEGCQ